MPTDLDFETFKRTAVSASEQFIEEYDKHGYAGLAVLEERLKRIANGDLPLPDRRKGDPLFYLMSKSPGKEALILEQLQEPRHLLEWMQAMNEYQLERWREIAKVRLFVLEDMLWSWTLGLPVIPYSDLSDSVLHQIRDDFINSEIAREYMVYAAWILVRHPQLSTLKDMKEKIGEYREELDLTHLSEGDEGARVERTLRNHLTWKGFKGFKSEILSQVPQRGITIEDLAEIKPSENTGQKLRKLVV